MGRRRKTRRATPPSPAGGSRSPSDPLGDAVRAAVGALRAEVTTLRTEVAELRRQLAAGSTTSSKPPSTDLSRAGRRVVSLRRPSGRPAGGQPGHAGRTLEWRRPDVVVCHVPERCAGCGRALGRPGAAPADGARGGALGVRLLERAQVIDLPPVTLTVTAHERVAVTCRHCGVESGAAFPGGVRAGVQYGPGVRAFAVALHSYHLLPYARTAECLDGLLGTGPSPGSITRWVAQAARALAPAAETARATPRTPMRRVSTSRGDAAGCTSRPRPPTRTITSMNGVASAASTPGACGAAFAG